MDAVQTANDDHSCGLRQSSSCIMFQIFRIYSHETLPINIVLRNLAMVVDCMTQWYVHGTATDVIWEL